MRNPSSNLIWFGGGAAVSDRNARGIIVTFDFRTPLAVLFPVGFQRCFFIFRDREK